ncbi:MAG: hypothetical protein GX945_13255 [Lentisphaerae bacterium]|nr:hypothetical protein [Lentisphaerota bacterium]
MFLSKQNRELSELAKKHGYSDDIQRLLAEYPICQGSLICQEIENNASEEDLVISVFMSREEDGPVLVTDNPEKELREYYAEARREALAKYKKHLRNGKFVFSLPPA